MVDTASTPTSPLVHTRTLVHSYTQSITQYWSGNDGSSPPALSRNIQCLLRLQHHQGLIFHLQCASCLWHDMVPRMHVTIMSPRHHYACSYIKLNARKAFTTHLEKANNAGDNLTVLSISTRNWELLLLALILLKTPALSGHPTDNTGGILRGRKVFDVSTWRSANHSTRCLPGWQNDPQWKGSLPSFYHGGR